MADIAIKKKNNVYLTVQSDPSIAQELVDHFSFDAPGAKFHPLFRNKLWDGKIKLFSMFTKELYVGLKTYLEHFAEVNNYTIDYSEYIETADTLTVEQLKDFINELNEAATFELPKALPPPPLPPGASPLGINAT